MKKLLLISFLLFFINYTKGQSFGFQFEKDKQSIQFPFEIKNNFIVVTVVLNKKLPLKFIFDTGAEHTILTKKKYSYPLNLSFDRSIKFVGADLSFILTAYVSRGVRMELGDAIAPTQDILIFDDDYFKIDEFIGEEIHGILGADMFKQYAVEFDHKKNIITFHRSQSFQPPNDWSELPIIIEKGKPYMKVKGTFHKKEIELKLLIDSGASLSLLIHANTHPDLNLPEKYIPGSIGTGMGGILKGFLGRVNRIEFGEFHFDNMIANYQDFPDSLNISTIPLRNGIFGNVLLMRFDFIIDYYQEKIYFKPHRKYNKSIKYDRSGLELIASGEGLKTILIRNVISNSPAAKAGLKNGDIIRNINGIPISFLSLYRVSYKLQKRVGKNITMTILRGDKKMKFAFQLKELI